MPFCKQIVHSTGKYLLTQYSIIVSNRTRSLYDRVLYFKNKSYDVRISSAGGILYPENTGSKK